MVEVHRDAAHHAADDTAGDALVGNREACVQPLRVIVFILTVITY